MKLGYFLSCEEWGPKDLVELAVKAERVGFDGLWISDHFHPWNDEQGHSPFVWSVISAIAQATDRMSVTTAVTCPTMRIHPAVVAQAAATSAIQLDGRFCLGVGSGEALNEHILGDRWPGADEVERFRSKAGGQKPVQGGMKVCWADDERQAVDTVKRLWPNDALPGELAQILPTPKHFEQASELVTEEMLAEEVPCGPDVERHVEALRAYADAGFDELYVQQIGPEQDEFFEAYRDEVLPRIASELSGARSLA
jgi:alkanesulfonate monooxygenase SsuD/methylene tetrahydromethanopterin reductase-like flavin-dependent oxidoreductase (luciferase family)